MKIAYTLLMLLLASNYAFGQSRLVGVEKYICFGNSYALVDSNALAYKAGNTTNGSAQDYLDDKLQYDTLRSFMGTSPGLVAREYDAASRLVKEIVRATTTPVITDQQIETFAYDAAGHVVQHHLTRKNVNGIWDTISYRLYTYDATGNMLTKIRWYTSSNPLSGLDSTRYFYNGNQLLSALRYSWIPIKNITDSTSRHIYHYDAQGRLDTVQENGSAGGGPVWGHVQRSVYVYGVNHVMQTDETANMSSTGGPWQNLARYETFYDAQNNMTAKYYWQWYPFQNHWGHQQTDTVEKLSTSPLITRYLAKHNSAAGFVNSKATTWIADAMGRWVSWADSTWDAPSQKWIIITNDEKMVFHYSRPTHVSNAAQAVQANIYPNPASYYINIELAAPAQSYTIAVYTIAGQLAMQQQGTGARHTLPIAHLDAGNYMLSVTTKEGVVTKPFVVLR